MKYDSSFDALLKEIRKQADEQGYMTADNDSTLSALEKSLGSNLERDLQFKKKEIKHYLEEEIATRYYGDGGRVAVEITDDPVVETAISIIESPEYKAILKGSAVSDSSHDKAKKGKSK